ncbi:response regulator [Lysobacter arenosi]|uniref:histidine kinase n=1 Tax=Lysobacter arenosi TaxID=2795387 RepID=A0ABX7R8Y6_9GAMM|nr:ATP-binding protein [Lysobacter arenosi]QSX73834.1 response regulator [Lysobacter arenosi]
MGTRDLNRVFESLQGDSALLRAGPGFPIVAITPQLRSMAADPGNTLGRPYFELFPDSAQAPGSVATLNASFERVIRTRSTDRHTQRLDIVDPSTGHFVERHWSSVNSPILDDAGEVEYILHQVQVAATGRGHESMAFLDARRAEQDRDRVAAQSEHQRRIYETALNNTPDFVYIFGTDLRAIYANDSLRKVWGVEDVRGKVWMELGYEQWHADMHDRELAQVIATKAPIRGEIPFTGTNGRRIYDYIFAPVLDGAGNVVAVAGTTRDVTDRQAAEQIVREHADRLAEADRAKNEFLATLSHELRNPLAPLRNGIQILRHTTSADSPHAQIHEVLERQVDHLVRLVDDLMDVSRITHGNVSLQSEPVELRTVVENAVEAVRPEIDAGHHRLSIELPDASLVLHGDRVRLSQILTNLLNNAAKYSEPGSAIVLRGLVEDGSLSLSVSDHGMGMEPSEIPHLFEMFTRGGRATSSHHEGLGIGLALSRRLAALHGGSLDGTSGGPGKGSIFTLRLPLSGDADASPTGAGRRDVVVNLGLRLLLADDDTDAGDSLAEVLRLSGAEVHVVDNGGDALNQFESIDPDVVILDIGMPRMTGYDVARALRARGVEVPLIALTGWGQPADRERAFAAGFDHHLVKPIAISVLVSLLASLEASTKRVLPGRMRGL